MTASEAASSPARCRAHGLQPLGRPQGAPHASGAQLARALEHRHALVSHARPVMAFLNEQVQGSDSLVLLADAQGLLLHATGEPHFADGAPRVVHAGEHHLERNGFLTCAAAPIADPGGQLLGVLDISGDRRGYHATPWPWCAAAHAWWSTSSSPPATRPASLCACTRRPKAWAPSPKAWWRSAKTAGWSAPPPPGWRCWA